MPAPGARELGLWVWCGWVRHVQLQLGRCPDQPKRAPEPSAPPLPRLSQPPPPDHPPPGASAPDLPDTSTGTNADAKLAFLENRVSTLETELETSKCQIGILDYKISELAKLVSGGTTATGPPSAGSTSYQ